MSRVGKQLIKLPEGVKIQLQGREVVVESQKGRLCLDIPAGINVDIKNDIVTVNRENEEKFVRSLHGTIRALIYNMVIGVSTGFKKELEIIGVGYKAQLKGKSLILNMGFSHPVEIPIPEGLKITVPRPTNVVVEGVDRQLVGQFAADVRRIFPPEPYKGKGIRYMGEEVRKKLGKALAK